MNAIVAFCPSLDRPDLEALLQQEFAPQKGPAWYLVRRPDEAPPPEDLSGAQTATLLDSWWEGRVFSRRLEVRWRAGGSYAVLLLTEEDKQVSVLDGFEPVPGQWTVVDRTDVRRHGLYLWGRYDDNLDAWVEVRIPRFLQYPVPKPKGVGDPALRFVRVGHYDYCAPNGAVQLVRWTEVG
ncbi:MAG: hypothetical protein FJ026_00600 [Chloroflexi bacterium]|nr:hypothetical protein [Chloroflexota bacterium]